MNNVNYAIITVSCLFSMVDFQQNVFVETIPSCLRGPLDITDSIKINCHVFHFGPVKWFKVDASSKVAQEITDSRVKEHNEIRTKTGHLEKNSTLTLSNITRSDAGAYVCWKHNGYNKTDNVTVFIDVAGKSLLNKLELHVDGRKLKTTHLHCFHVSAFENSNFFVVFRMCISKHLRKIVVNFQFLSVLTNIPVIYAPNGFFNQDKTQSYRASQKNARFFVLGWLAPHVMHFNQSRETVVHFGGGQNHL